jgi:molybdate transport system substrate-binding protein
MHPPAARRRRFPGAAAVLALVLLAVVGCSSSLERTGPPGNDAADTLRGDVTVYADSSLREAFAQIQTDFASVHPNVHVSYVYDDTSSLVSRLPGTADVVAVVGTGVLEEAIHARTVDDPITFARDPLALAIPQANPRGINLLTDVSRPGVRFAMCDETEPCGQAADMVLQSAGVTPSQVVRLPGETAVLAAIESGRVDAGLALSSDLAIAEASTDKVRRVNFTPKSDLATGSAAVGTVPYLAATVSSSGGGAAAQAFVDELTAPEARSIFTSSGFTR